MIYRRLQRIGGGTLFISLPRSWVRNRGLKKGDLVEIEETANGSIIISPYQLSSDSVKLFASITVNEEDRQRVEREVAAAYLSGREIIKLLYGSNSYRIKKIAKEIGKSFLGLELVEEDDNSSTYRFMLEEGGMTPEKIFRRMNVIAKSMYIDSVKAALAKDRELKEDIINRDEEMDRLYFLGVRMLRQVASDSSLSAKYSLSAMKALDYRVAYQHLEYMGDVACKFSELVFPRSDALQIERVIQKISEVHDSALLHFFGSAKEPYSSFLHSVSAVQRDIGMLSQTESQVILALNEFLRLIVDIADLAGTLYPYVR
jgi:Phosphate uptake regulator